MSSHRGKSVQTLITDRVQGKEYIRKKASPILLQRLNPINERLDESSDKAPQAVFSRTPVTIANLLR